MRRGDVGTSPPKLPRSLAAAVPFAVALGTLIIYLKTLYPDVAGG